VQQLFLSGQGSSTAEADLDDESAAAAAAPGQQQQEGLTESLTRVLTGFDLQQQWRSYCQKGYGVAAAASGSCTDAANRLTHILKGLAGTTTPEVLNRVSADWVPLLLGFAAAVTHGGAAEEEMQEDVTAEDAAAAAAEDAAAGAAAAAAAAAASENAAVGAKRKQPDPAAAAEQQQQQQAAKRQRGSGLAGALSREGLGCLGFSIRAWRGVMMEWLALLGALKNPKKQQRWVTWLSMTFCMVELEKLGACMDGIVCMSYLCLCMSN
jgi:hypothetical protein